MITLRAATTALMVVDMQNDFCSPGGYYASSSRDISKLSAAIAPVARLVEIARAANSAIVFTRLVHDRTRGPMEQRHALKPRRWTAGGDRLVPGTWGAAIVDELTPRANDLVVDKAGYSAFDDTALEGELRARGLKTLILCGVVTYACVLATGFAAFDRGFDVVLATDAAGSWNDALGTGTSDIVDLLLGYSVSIDDIQLVRGADREPAFAAGGVQ